LILDACCKFGYQSIFGCALVFDMYSDRVPWELGI